ncbi:MAG TPA: hypothetical protein DIS82_06235 [Exiguobacterium sp.]|uniref:hypothetical protein n=1 Tax=Exiguobacterium sp. TaxID=44751 RepID=UPI000EE0D9B1|nr:hypothetical protein [Exiguobacterium sp.]HCN57740.1 hypothetical protein [Exiguobacterium sp.]
MNNIKLHNGSYNKVIYLVFMICVFTNSGYALNTTSFSYISTMLLLIAVLSFFLTLLIKNKINIAVDKLEFIALLLMVPIFLSILIHLDFNNLMYTMRILLIIFVSYIICKEISFENFTKFFTNVMYILTLVSILVSIISFYISFDWLPNVLNVNNVNYINGYLFFLIPDNSDGIPRAMSIFWEPGIFATFLIFSLILESFFKKKNGSLLKIIAFSVALLLTQSSAGYFLYIIYLLMIVEKYNGNKIHKIFANLILFNLLLLIIVFWNQIKLILLNLNYNIFSKFFSEDIQTTNTRLLSPLLNLEIFSSSPLLGKGFVEAEKNYNFLKLNYDISFRIDAQTSTSTLFLAAIGITGIIYTLLWVVSIYKLNNLSFLNRVYLLVIILCILNKEPHTQILFTYCLLFYFYTNNNLFESRLKNE